VTDAILLGSLLGVFSGIVPGPFSALIAATALERGFWVGVRVAVVPLLTEVVALALTALLLDRLPEQVLGYMGMAGGVLVLWLAWRTFRRAGDPPEAEPMRGSGRRILQSALVALLSPAPWVFWLLVGSPLFLASWRQGWVDGLAFLGSFLVWLVGIYVGIAAAAAYGQRRLGETGYRRLRMGTAWALLVAGGVLLWQSWEGNFQSLVSGSESVREAVEERVP
jgi:threonine/homoserine/homoserine lactone efflux protein